MTLRVGLIGLGEVAQLMHLPLLADDPRCRIAGVSDVSGVLTETLGHRYGVPLRTTRPEELIASPEIDAVFVLTPDELHASLIEAALAAGKHVFVEKPAALTAEALRPLLGRAPGGPVVFVGYMRRFSRPFLAMAERMPDASEIRHVRIRDLICEAPFFVAQTRPVLRGEDVPEDVVEASRARAEAMVRTVVGEGASADEVRAYRVLTGLGCHSLSAMRELLGVPRRVLSAHQSGGLAVSALFDYGGFACSYEAAITDVPVFDSGIDVIAQDRRLSLTYDTPYIRHLPTALTITQADQGGAAREVIGPHHADPFRIELDAFHDAVTHGGPVKTSVEDSLADLELIAEIAGAMRAGARGTDAERGAGPA